MCLLMQNTNRFTLPRRLLSQAEYGLCFIYDLHTVDQLIRGLKRPSRPQARKDRRGHDPIYADMRPQDHTQAQKSLHLFYRRYCLVSDSTHPNSTSRSLSAYESAFHEYYWEYFLNVQVGLHHRKERTFVADCLHPQYGYRAPQA